MERKPKFAPQKRRSFVPDAIDQMAGSLHSSTISLTGPVEKSLGFALWSKCVRSVAKWIKASERGRVAARAYLPESAASANCGSWFRFGGFRKGYFHKRVNANVRADCTRRTSARSRLRLPSRTSERHVASSG